MGTLLLITARILQMILSPIFYLYAIIRLHNLKKISDYFANIAFGIDQLGNIMGAPIMNDVLLKKDAIKLYGNPDETISNVTGVNYIAKKMTWCGRLIARMLNNVEAQHVEKAAKNEQ